MPPSSRAMKPSRLVAMYTLALMLPPGLPGPGAQVAQDAKLSLRGRVGGRRLVRHLQVPARRLAGPFRRGAGVQRHEGQLLRFGVGAQDAQVRYDDRGAPATVPEPLPGVAARAVADGGHEREFLD